MSAAPEMRVVKLCQSKVCCIRLFSFAVGQFAFLYIISYQFQPFLAIHVNIGMNLENLKLWLNGGAWTENFPKSVAITMR